MLLTLVACSPDSLTGNVVLSGSSTLAPLAQAAVESWRGRHPRVDARVEAIGSDAGLERLIRYGDAEFALVSRPMQAPDFAAARTAGVDLVVLPLAWDAVAVVVPASNSWAVSLTREQVTRAFTTATLWSDLDPSWPSRPLHRFALGPNSGTADVLAASLLSGHKERLFSAPSVQASEDDTILARGVAQVEGGLGYLGWTHFREADPSLKLVALDGVRPSDATIRDNSYGLPRQLWLVTTRQVLADSEAASSMLSYLYTHVGEFASQVGLVPLSESEKTAVADRLNSAQP